MNIQKYFQDFSDEYLNRVGADFDPDLLGDWTEGDSLFADGLTDRDTGLGHVVRELRMPHLDTSSLTGGDLDDDWYQAEVVGEEAVGGQTPTPDQNVTEGLLLSVGLSSVDGQPIETWDELQGRDDRRWELEPESAEDYGGSSDDL
ncbi:MAG: DUF6335 family protein [Cyanobacteriota bacterium]|jgi:hypothetical protein